MKEKYDVIVIGSGIGGLTFAALMSKVFKKKVLVLEKHFKIGGFTHDFKRKNYQWDVGIHYIGEMYNESMVKKVFDFISDSKVKWNKMPDIFEKFIYPDFTFNVYSNESRYKIDLIKQFPKERSNIIKYFKDLKKATKALTFYFILQTLPNKIKNFLLPYLNKISPFYNMTTKDYLDKNFKDEKLKALVVSQWGDYGLTPEKSSFLIHSVIATHYFNGGYYPVGGAGKIAESIIPVIESNGGKVLSSHTVKEIIIKNDTAIGVKVEHNLGNKIEELEFYASKIVSNTGAYITYKKLLSEKYSINFKDDLQNLSKQGTKHINVFLGLKDTPEKLGFKGENHWVYNSYNHSDSNNFDSYYLSFPSLKNPESKFHTVEIIVLFNDENKFNEWINTKWKKRGFEYEILKQEIANKLIDQVESRYNGFKDLIDYVEVSTPLTTEYFTSHHNGNIYGIPATPEKYQKTWLGINTNVKNLYLTGTDAGSHGFVGAMMTAVLATGVVSGMPLGLFKIFRSILNK